ncbi:hypothetical protein D1872_327900 [compost metagenome]
MSFVFSYEVCLLTSEALWTVDKAFPINTACQFKANGCGDFVWVFEVVSKEFLRVQTFEHVWVETTGME